MSCDITRAESVGFEPTRPVTRPSGFQEHYGYSAHTNADLPFSIRRCGG